MPTAPIPPPGRIPIWTTRRCALTKGQRQAGSGVFSEKDNLENPIAMDALSVYYKSVDKSVLIPRADTEKLCELTIEQAKPRISPRILDLCCGSGCIGIAAAHEVEDARVLAVDLSDGALRLTRENAHRLGVSGRLLAMKADATMPPPGGVGPFDIIVSNPPYITRSEMAQLDHSVADFEPHEALYGGVDGLDFYRAICENWGDTLAHGGILLFECGWKQADAVAEILQKYGFSDVCIEKDDAGVPRIVIGRSSREDDDLTK